MQHTYNEQKTCPKNDMSGCDWVPTEIIANKQLVLVHFEVSSWPTSTSWFIVFVDCAAMKPTMTYPPTSTSTSHCCIIHETWGCAPRRHASMYAYKYQDWYTRRWDICKWIITSYLSSCWCPSIKTCLQYIVTLYIINISMLHNDSQWISMVENGK